MNSTRPRRPTAPGIALEQLEPRETPAFLPGPIFTNGLDQPKRVVVADFNGDGLADLAVANVFVSTLDGPGIQILLGNGDGTFTTGQELTDPLLNVPRELITGDFNGDGLADLAVTSAISTGSPGGGSTLVFLGAGGGGFNPTAVLVDRRAGLGIATADFTGDGTPDLVVAIPDVSVGGGFQVYAGNGNGTFTPLGQPIFAFPSDVRIVADDFDGDGNQDFATLDLSAGQLVAAYGNGNGTFAPLVRTDLPGFPLDLVAGDFDGDGQPDVVTAESDTLVLHRNLGGRAFDPAGTFVLGAQTTLLRIAAADFDRNGLPDLVTLDASGGGYAAYNQGGGSFTPDPLNPYTLPAGATDVATGDMDRDGNPDFVVVSQSGNTGQVFFNGERDTTVTTVVSSPNPSLAGEPVTFTVTVTAPGAGVGAPPITGRVDLLEGSTLLGSGNLDPTGTVVITVSSLSVGTHTLTAFYAGSPNYLPSFADIVQQVNQVPTTTALTADPNPSLAGQPVTLTATVTPAAATSLVPTGTVTFFDGGTVIGSAPVDSSGTAQIIVSNLAVGSHPITATYSGDASFLTSSGAVTQQVDAVPTATALIADPNPSLAGQPVTLTATVTPAAATSLVPTGTVTFFDGPTPLGSAALGSNGTAVITLATLAPGSHTVLASYSGDAAYLPSTSAPVGVTVEPPVVPPPPPPPPGEGGFLAGSDFGNVVCVLDLSGRPGHGIAVAPADFQAVRVASADFNNDGVLDPVVGSGVGTPPRVAAINGATGVTVATATPFEESFLGGVFVAAGDIDGDGLEDVAVGADVGGGSRVVVYRGRPGELVPLLSFDPFGDPRFRGGVRVALADVNGDGFADLICAPGKDGGPRIATFDGRALAAGVAVRLWNDFYAFDEGSRVGAFVAGGDLNGDGYAEIVVGADAGGSARVSVFDGRALTATGLPEMTANFFSGSETTRGGVRVAVRDANGDGRADLLTGAGVGEGSRVRVYSGQAVTASPAPAPLAELDAFPGLIGGVYIG